MADVERERSGIEELVGGVTLVDILDRNAERSPAQPAIAWQADGRWQRLDWVGYREVVHQAAAGLRTLGVGHDDFVAILSGNRPEHVIADLGAVHAGATGVTVYSTLAPSQIQYIAENCGAKVAVVENAASVERWLAIRDRLPLLTHLVVMDPEGVDLDTEGVLSWTSLLARGADELVARPGLIADATSSITPESLATLIYTSGTTGVPKGVMITHHNVLWTAEAVRRVIDDLPEHPKMVSYLPLAHIAERMSTHYFGLYAVGEVYYCPALDQVLDFLQEARPNLFVAVPRVWEKFHARLRSRFDENPRKALIERALAHNERVVEARFAGESVGLVDRAKMALFDRLVFGKVREQLGMDEVLLAISSAAPISEELLVFFQAIGVPVYELYGLSETTGPAITNLPGANRVGTVGRPLPGVEVELTDDGEVRMRGGNIAKGYYRLPEASDGTFGDDGWLYSGDLGRLDDGYLTIVGRKKEIIITAAGKNIAPAKLEGLVRNHPLVAQACMIGDRRKYLTMLIGLDAEEAPAWAADRGVPFESLAEFSRRPEVLDAIQQAIDEANEEVASAEQVKKFVVAPDEWTPETEELTPSLKLKRRVVLERYDNLIEGMYADA